MKKLITPIALGLSTLIATPLNAFAYTVKSGDTMSKIAKENNISLQDLSKANPQIKNIDLIYVGQNINLTAKEKTPPQSSSMGNEGFKNFISTAYSTDSVTATGTSVSQGRTIAVDPNVIPLGSKVEIIFPSEYSYLNGIYIAEDTGGAIKGNKIDLYLNSKSACINFGVRNVQLKIIK